MVIPIFSSAGAYVVWSVDPRYPIAIVICSVVQLLLCVLMLSMSSSYLISFRWIASRLLLCLLSLQRVNSMMYSVFDERL